MTSESHTLYLFNPDHDMALGVGSRTYMPPKSAYIMAEDLASLPVWVGNKTSRVLVPSSEVIEYIKKMRAHFSSIASGILPEEVHQLNWDELKPWGWNKSLCFRLNALNVSHLLPDDDSLDYLREKSHRKLAVKCLSQFRIDCPELCGTSAFLENESDWKNYVESHANCVLKAPLSGSGKGLRWCRGVYTDSLSGWCLRISKMQGGIIAEPHYDKIIDFAMEFVRNKNGEISFLGYSLFTTTSSGSYEGNILMSDEDIEKLLCKYVTLNTLKRVQKEICYFLFRELSSAALVTYIGVDMMISKQPEDNTKYALHPCVEINLRMNMGVLSHILFERFVACNKKGYFKVAYFSEPMQALATYQDFVNTYPLLISKGRVEKGFLSLNLVNEKSQYMAYILID